MRTAAEDGEASGSAAAALACCWAGVAGSGRVAAALAAADAEDTCAAPSGLAGDPPAFTEKLGCFLITLMRRPAAWGAGDAGEAPEASMCEKASANERVETKIAQ